MNDTKKRKRFMPQNRGNLTEAVAENKLSQVAPSSPRSSGMLNVKINGRNLTAADLALYEMLLANAYGDDEEMQAKLFSIPVADVQNFIKQMSLRASLSDSLKRLASATAEFRTGRHTFENSSLIVSWIETDDEDQTDKIQYSFTKPIRTLMSKFKSYAYIELIALSKMKSKYSSQLYKKFALQVAQKEWQPNESNEYTLTGTPDEIAEWAGLDDPNFSLSNLNARVLSFLDDDFKNVRAFSVRMHQHRKSGRGRTVERIDFILTVKPPSHFSKHVSFKKGAHKKLSIGAPDDPKYRVNSYIWEKVAKAFFHKEAKRLKSADADELMARPAKIRSTVDYSAAYFYAINEALTNDPISPIYNTGKFRGQRLLKAIQELGPDEAAWQFCHEEFEKQDILSFLENNDVANKEADDARIARLKALQEQQAEPVVTAVAAPIVIDTQHDQDDVKIIEDVPAAPELLKQKYTGMTSYESDEDDFVNSSYDDA